MVSSDDEVVQVASGTLVQVELWHDALKQEGIVSRLVGDDLMGGLGSTLANAVQLYVHAGDAARAKAVLEQVEREKGTLTVPEDVESTTTV